MHSGYVRLIIVLGIIYLRPDQNHDVKRIFGAVFIQITISFCRRHQTMIHIGSASFLAKRYFYATILQKKLILEYICLLDFGKFKKFLASFPEYWKCTW